jgi:hypothetical protein
MMAAGSLIVRPSHQRYIRSSFPTLLHNGCSECAICSAQATRQAVTLREGYALWLVQTVARSTANSYSVAACVFGMCQKRSLIWLEGYFFGYLVFRSA